MPRPSSVVTERLAGRAHLFFGYGHDLRVQRMDERIEAGYAALFALGIIAKILAVQVIAVL